MCYVIQSALYFQAAFTAVEAFLRGPRRSVKTVFYELQTRLGVIVNLLKQLPAMLDCFFYYVLPTNLGVAVLPVMFVLCASKSSAPRVRYTFENMPFIGGVPYIPVCSVVRKVRYTYFAVITDY